ncbi:MAG: hydrogenobyrinic acid a,c-diamide synthase (glutamine-hydrolyzing) [Gammaproteobacteria bacterium]|nr:hydrogenobyrinic acid a,c-diamide synthase (glutamine-hydrolyzing) [Gammaproteobacteria bacterium]
MAHFFISAAYKSSGKTTVSLGLCAALKKRKLIVQPFKKGPDYIDPMWLGRAAARPCHNLDFNTMSNNEITTTFAHFSQNTDISIIEGNKGLYDGLDLNGSNSNAALCKLIQAPVILVIDARGMTRGIAPLILGYQAFDADVNIAGIILNKLGGRRHEKKLRAVIEHYTNIPVLGAILRDSQLEISERHLGLIPSEESAIADKLIHNVATMIEEQVDLDAILAIANKAKSPEAKEVIAIATHTKDIRIGVAQDAAFNFYYPGDLDALQNAGAELMPINTLKDTQLPDIDGLFIGGGFPEMQMAALEQNAALRKDIYDKIEAGLPTYAECGGLMYLARSIAWNDKKSEMVGVIQGDVVMHEKPQGRGYVRLKETGKGLWKLADNNQTTEIPAHEFHYSSLENIPDDTDFAYEVLRGYGINGKYDGIIYKNLLANFMHLRDVETNHWAERFINFVRKNLH